jgi:uncharacterized protein YjbI with pentapeptide repeats
LVSEKLWGLSQGSPARRRKENMKFEIKNRWTGKVLFKAEIGSLKLCLELAIKSGASLVGANLDGASLNGARLNGASLIGASLDRASLNGARLNGASLIGANLDGASLIGASLDGASLNGARLNGASLNGASLIGASLIGANLDRASLVGASLDGANLNGASLDGASLDGARLDKKYVQVSRIGSAKRMTTYCVDDDKIWCGCFTGTLAEFKAKIEATHENNPVYLAEYTAAVEFFKSVSKANKKSNQAANVAESY